MIIFVRRNKSNWRKERRDDKYERKIKSSKIHNKKDRKFIFNHFHI